ncbi:hypothetical protein BD626DRAFT_508912 [Schizophyllum amplum]|uniref:Uncharacterized protein n=1 Tax=Schizophyllum amplum TaxID=97359 RepID=A0A550C2S7_9AGAR|nr:hypothetical protein BD626DRAFT_508912 [Auriculariopsis ampla]
MHSCLKVSRVPSLVSLLPVPYSAQVVRHPADPWPTFPYPKQTDPARSRPRQRICCSRPRLSHPRQTAPG